MGSWPTSPPVISLVLIGRMARNVLMRAPAPASVWTTAFSCKGPPNAHVKTENTRFTSILPLITQLDLYIPEFWRQKWNHSKNLKTMPRKSALTVLCFQETHLNSIFYKKIVSRGRTVEWWLYYPPTLCMPSQDRVSPLLGRLCAFFILQIPCSLN